MPLIRRRSISTNHGALYVAAPGGGGGATFDSGNTGSQLTLSNGNRTATGSGSGWSIAMSTTSKTTGKYYVEFEWTTGGQTSVETFGIGNNNQNINSFPSAAGDCAVVRGTQANPLSSGKFTVTGANLPTHSAVQGGTTAFAVDFDAGKGWMAYDNTFGGDPAAGTNPFITWTADASAIFFMYACSSSNAATCRATSGQQTYSPPSGFSAWG